MHACHRPFSAGDRPIIGPAVAFRYASLCTGFGSGSLSASLILYLDCLVILIGALFTTSFWNEIFLGNKIGGYLTTSRDKVGVKKTVL